MTRVFAGEDALREMLAVLENGGSATKPLARQIHDFYGDHLLYEPREDWDSSKFEIDLTPERSTILESAKVKLKTGTDRMTEALTHELLHLELPPRGFPVGHSLNVPDHLDAHAKTFIEMIGAVTNLVQHQIFFSRFVELGYRSEFFLGQSTPAPDYERLASAPNKQYIPEIGFPWFCLEFLRHWICIRHTNEPGLDASAQAALTTGSLLEQDLPLTVQRMQEWVERGRFKKPDQYANQFNNLLDLMRIPRFNGWISLTCTETGKPVATRIKGKRR
jgi:hypothetical protein